MRKILFLMAMLVCSLQFAMAGDVVTRDVNKLPVAAREMIGKHFSQTKVAYIKIEKDLFQSTSYDVKLADGIELEFNSKGEWLEIDCKNKAVPSTFIPQAISKYMKANYNGRACLGLHFSNTDLPAKQVLTSCGGILVRFVGHHGRRCDGVDGSNVGKRIRDMRRSVVTVSYTHLDVYKRQDLLGT